MLLEKMWLSHPEEVESINIERIVGLAGGLRDGSDGSLDYRSFLSHISSNLLARYASECLSDSFKISGFALQDIINEVGRRLDFVVTHGRYQGVRGQNNADGLWRSTDGNAIIVEIKTTNAYAIDLSKIANYREQYIVSESADSRSSILIIVGRDNTGGLEAQVRGSNYASTTRLISMDALLRLLHIKESAESPEIGRKIRSILAPHDFMKLDGIVDLVFSTTEDIRYSENVSDNLTQDTSVRVQVQESGNAIDVLEKPVPAHFNEDCVARIQRHLNRTLVQRTRTVYAADDLTLVSCAVSKVYARKNRDDYWFAFHQHTAREMEETVESFVGFGCGTSDNVLCIPFSIFAGWLEGMNTTDNKGRSYWHVSISAQHGKFTLHRKKGYPVVDLSSWLLGNPR